MTLHRLSEAEIYEVLSFSWERMSLPQRRLWQVISCQPHKWDLPPWSDATAGFWVVGCIGTQVIFHNEIEGGFNRSSYSSHGRIDRYSGTGFDLSDVVQWFLNWIADGYDSAPRVGPPESGPAPGHPLAWPSFRSED